jgi:error-prone DNA polymerase
MVKASGFCMAYSLERVGHHEWLSKSNFSFLKGASHPLELLETAAQYGYRSLCLNDFDGVYGLARSHLNLKEKIEGDLKLYYGAEIHLRRDHDRPLLFQHTLALVALNRQGYHHLCQLLSYSHQSSKDEAFLLTEELLQRPCAGLAAVLPMRGMIREQEFPLDLGALKEHFAGRLYLATTRLLHPAEDFWIPHTLELAREYQLPTLLSQDIFFHERARRPLHDLLQAIRTNSFIEDCDAFLFPNSERCFHSLPSLDRLYQKLPNYQAAIRHSLNLAEQIDFSFDELSYQYPAEMIPTGFSSQQFLEELTWTGMQRRLGDHFNEELKQKVRHELALIQKLEFADYFLTVWDIVRWAREQDILCQGRGSAANSIVCFALEITSIKPHEFELLLERFISEERGDPPDIDVDFEHERREEVIQYIYQRYGRHRASMVANIITFRRKGSMRAVGKALGVPEEVISHASKLQRMRLYRGLKEDEILKVLGAEKEELPVDVTTIPWKLWGDYSSLLTGFPRHMGIHSGGFIISGRALDELVPQEPATMEGRTVIQWCKDDIEGLGFFKIDVLALGMLSALRKAFHLVEEYYGKKLGLYQIPEGDEKTYAMIQRADTVGTFQIESRAQMTMLPRLKPRCFYDLVVEVAIIRPGPIQGKVIHPYLRRRDGIESVTFPDPCLEPILKRTLGIAIFQEQAMRIAVEVGDFTPGEANELRRNIGSWNIRDFDQNLGPWLTKLERGMRAKGFDDEFVSQILQQMRGFSEYGFPESHAISFALIAYASCYLKCHYPAAFFVSVLNSQPMGFYSPHNLIQAAKRDGVRILAPTVNDSDYFSTLEKVGEDYAIRMGFHLVNQLSKGAAEAIVLKRQEHGRFQLMEDFVALTNLYRDDLTALAHANAFSCFRLSRSKALWYSESIPQKPMIDLQEDDFAWLREGRMESTLKDFSAINTCLNDHPARIFRQEHWCYPLELKKLTNASELSQKPADEPVNVFGLIRVKQSPPTAKGMVFISLEDETGFSNLVFHPYKYTAFAQVIEKEHFLCVQGTLQKAGDYTSILVDFLYPKRQFVAPISSIKQGKTEEKKLLSLSPPLGEEGLPSPRQYY